MSPSGSAVTMGSPALWIWRAEAMPHYLVREAFRMFYPAYREGHAVTPEQESAAQCIMGCKTGVFGYSVSLCPECGTRLIHNASCGNRNCSCCQGTKPEEWVGARSSELVEGLSYFHVIATTPHELNPLFLSNPADMYGLLMKSIGTALTEVSLREENLGAVPGFVSVLHSWSQNLELHPHVHLLVSGGGLSDPVTFKKVDNNSFFCPEGHLRGAFREHFLSGLKDLRKKGSLSYTGSASNLLNHFEWEGLLTALYQKSWNVFIKETFNGNGNAVEYLSRYAYRTAISNSRILSVTDEGVVISYKDYHDGGKKKELFLSGEEFIRRFLMHVLPKGFCRIRYGGFLSNSRKKRCLAQIRRLTGTPARGNPYAGLSVRERIKMIFNKDIYACPACNGTMHTYMFRKWGCVMLN